MGTNYIAPMWRMPENANKDKLSNYSINFGSTTQYISTPSTWQTDIGLDNVKKLSFSVWVNPNSGTGSSIMAVTSQAYGSWNGNFNITYRADPSLIALEFRGVGSVFNNTTTTLTPNTWSHICFVIDLNLSPASSAVKCFINNSEIPSGNAGSTPLNFVLKTTSFNIGRTLWGSGFTGYQWEGKIAQACFFDYALDLDQRTYLYNLNNPMAISGAEPVGYWPLGDNSNPNAPGSFPNISVGADSVFDFTNSDQDYINLGSTPIVTGVFTTSMWIKRSSLTPNNVSLFAKDDTSSNRVFHAHFVNSSNVIGFWVSPTGAYDANYRVQTTTPISDLNWHHVVFVNRGNNIQNEIWIDGQEASYSTQGTGTSTLYNSSTVNTVIGAHSTITNRTFNGEISNVQFWDTDLQDSDIATLYNNGQPLMTGTQPQESNLQAWYKLNQSANWEADTANNWQIPDNRSAYPQSFSFNGSSQRIKPGTNVSLGITDAITVSAWVRIPTTNTGGPNPYIQAIVCEDAVGGTNRNWTLFWRHQSASNKYFQFSVWHTDGTVTPLQSTGIVPNDGEWHHIVGTFDGTTNANGLKLYVDNNLFQTTANGTGVRSTLGVHPSIGSAENANVYFFEGNISNVSIWETDLNSTQVETLYNNGVPLTTAIATDNLKAWYKLDNTANYSSFTNYWSVYNDKTPAPTPTFTNAIRYLAGYYNPPQKYGGIGFTNTAWSSSDITISAWLRYPKGFDGANGLELLRNSQIACIFDSGSSGRRFRVGTGSVYKAFTTNITDGLWHHYLAYIPNGATTNLNDIRLWQDGIELSGSNIGSSYSIPITNIIGIGSGNQNGGGGRPTFNVSNYALFDTDQTSNIDTIFNNGVPGDISSLNPSIWYKADSPNVDFLVPNNTSVSFTDSSGNNNTGTGPIDTSAPTLEPYMETIDVVAREVAISSGMTEQNLVNNNVSVLNGESLGMNTTNLVQSNLTRKVPFSNYSMFYDSVNVYSTFDTPFSVTATDDFSWSFWVRPIYNSITENAILRVNATGITQTGTIRIQHSGGNWRPYFDGSSGNNFNPSTYDMPDDEWSHMVLSVTANGTRYWYVNGVQVATDTGTGVATTGSWLGFSSESTTSDFEGYLSQCAYWDVALTTTELAALYNNGIPQDLRNFSVQPTQYWPMNQDYSYWDGSVWINRDIIAGNDSTTVNTAVISAFKGNAPGSEANGTGSNLSIDNLRSNMKSSDKNAYSINMADYADGVTNPANSGRSTDTP